MMGDARARGGSRSTGAAAAISLAVIIVALVASALLAGATLDDFWTLYLADPSHGLKTLALDRWQQDIRPPIFDGWATLLSMAGLHAVPLARLVSNVPALAQP